MTETALCNSAEGLLAPAARPLIRDVCRDFLETAGITAVELLHVGRHQGRFLGTRGALDDAVTRAATVQAHGDAAFRRERQKVLTILAEALHRQTIDHEIAFPIPRDLDALMSEAARFRRACPPAKAAVFIDRAFAGYLSAADGWLEKFSLLAELCREVADRHEIRAVDAILAEAVHSETALDALFGPAANPGERIRDIADLHRGILDRKDRDQPSALRALSPLLRALPLPTTHAALEATALRLLAGEERLASKDLLTEMRAIGHTLTTLRRNGTMIGGQRALQHIERRIAAVVTTETLGEALAQLPDTFAKIACLTEIGGVVVGLGNQRVVWEALQVRLADSAWENTVLRGPEATLGKLKLLADLYRVVERAPADPKRIAIELRRLERLQRRLLAESRFLSSFETGAGRSADKALHLLNLCAEGHFIPGKCLEQAKRLAQRLTQAPDLLETLLADSTSDDDRQRRMEELRRRLSAVGLTLPASRRDETSRPSLSVAPPGARVGVAVHGGKPGRIDGRVALGR